jgi:hypothetical protein
MALVPYVQQDTDCLYTTVQNISGKERVFGFLGDRGKRLAAGEMVTIPGNLPNHLGGGGQWSQRRFKALERSLIRESLAIVNTPGVHVYDPINDVTRVVAQEGGLIGSVDPCWTKQSLSSSSSSGT